MSNAPRTEPDDPTGLIAAAEWVVLAPEAGTDRALQDRFTAWLAADPAHVEAYAEMAALWQDKALEGALEAHVPAAPPPAMAPRAAKARQTARQKPRWAARGGLLAMAASVAALLAISGEDLWIGWRADFRTATGARQTVTLPDGSRVELNTDTALALAYEGPLRRVELLRGEAYFEVNADPARPFVVSSRHAEVTATGTSFSVRRESDADSVLLLEGSVAVLGAQDSAATRLAPGEAARVDARARIVGTGQGEPSWRQGRIFFDHMTLEEVAAEVDRYLPGRTILLGSAGETISGSLLIDQLEDGLDMLTTAAGARLRRLPGGLRVIW